MALLSPTTALCSCGILVRMLVLCSVQLTGLPAVQVRAKLGSGSTLMEGWFPLWLLLYLSHTIETEALHWFVWTEGPARVCQWCTLESTAVKYQTKTTWSKHCVWEHISQRVQVSVYFPYCECMCIQSCIEKVVSLGDELRTCWLCSVQRLIQRVDWVVSHTRLGCAVFIILILVWTLSDLLEQTFLVNKVYDETRT